MPLTESSPHLKMYGIIYKGVSAFLRRGINENNYGNGIKRKYKQTLVTKDQNILEHYENAIW